MTTTNDNPILTDNAELLKQQSSACGPGCGCGAAGPSERIRRIGGTIILVAAAALVARAVMKDNGASSVPASAGFAALPAPKQPSEPDAVPDVAAKQAVTDALKEIAALSELNVVAADTDGVFVFLPGKTEATAKAPTEQIQGAVRTIEPQLRGGGKIGMFTLKSGSRDYEQIALQMPVPGVLAMVKGRGMSAVSGDITETKLVQAFVGASSAGGCGPSGCGPSGCN